NRSIMCPSFSWKCAQIPCAFFCLGTANCTINCRRAGPSPAVRTAGASRSMARLSSSRLATPMRTLQRPHAAHRPNWGAALLNMEIAELTDCRGAGVRRRIAGREALHHLLIHLILRQLRPLARRFIVMRRSDIVLRHTAPLEDGIQQLHRIAFA